MKTLCKSIKSSLTVLFLLALSFSLLAAEPPKKKTESVGLALSVTGQAFVVYDNRTKVLEPSDYLYDFSEIVTTENSQVTFKDKYDHKYHVAPSSHIKLLNRIVELKSGYLWVKSESQEKGFSIQTANAKVAYNQGEAIASFDVLSGKTQVLVVHGEMEFGNILLDENKVTLTDASFSFLTGEFENTMPRTPTGVGQASFSKIVSVFKGIQPEQGTLALTTEKQEKVEPKLETKVERSIASVEEKKGPGKFIIVKTKDPARELEEKEKKLQQAYERNLLALDQAKPKKKAAFKPDYSKTSTVAIKIYGRKTAPVERAPASVVPTSSESLDDYAHHMKQENEAQDLIDQLSRFRSE